MNKPFDFNAGDDLSDFLGGDAAPALAPKALPEGDAFARIRSYADQAPAAKAFQVDCRKCGGSGVWRGSYKTGPCFACKGKGKLERKTSPAKLAQAKEYRAALPGKRWDAFQAAHPAEAAFLVKTLDRVIPDSYRDILTSIKEAIDRYGDTLSEGRMGVLTRGVERDAAYAASKAVNPAPQAVPAAPVVDVSKIVDAFQRAQQAGLKRFKLRFSGVFFEQDKHDAAKIWVSESGYGSAKYGLIEKGVYKPGRAVDAQVRALIIEVAVDPLAAGIAYAQATSSCSVCGRHLENQDSVDAGIGPICAGRLNRPGLKFVEVKEGDF